MKALKMFLYAAVILQVARVVVVAQEFYDGVWPVAHSLDRTDGLVVLVVNSIMLGWAIYLLYTKQE